MRGREPRAQKQKAAMDILDEIVEEEKWPKRQAN